MTQDELRQTLEILHTFYGTPYSFIGKKLGITSQTMGAFARGVRNLSEEKQRALKQVFEELKGRF